MIARPYWDYNPEVCINDRKDRAVIDVDVEMLDSIMSQMRSSIEYKISGGRYVEVLEMLQSYLKLEEMMKAWMSKIPEECEDHE